MTDNKRDDEDRMIIPCSICGLDWDMDYEPCPCDCERDHPGPIFNTLETES